MGDLLEEHIDREATSEISHRGGLPHILSESLSIWSYLIIILSQAGSFVSSRLSTNVMYLQAPQNSILKTQLCTTVGIVPDDRLRFFDAR